MVQGYTIVQKLIEFPLKECGERFASIPDAATAAKVEMHFSSSKIAAMMEQHGFIHFPFEFWHFDKDDAGMHILTGNAAPCRFGPVNWNPQTNKSPPSKIRSRCSIRCP